jgi:DNA gyrase subunit B
MPELIERGYLYIAQPPLFRVKRGKTERYVQNETDLMAMLFELAAEDIQVSTPSGLIGGKKLILHLKKISTYEKLMEWFDRKRKDPEIISLLLESGIERSQFKSKETLSSLVEKIKVKIPNIKHGEISFDEEQEAYAVEIKRHNYKVNLSVSFIQLPEFKEIAQLHKEIIDIFGKPPYKLQIKEETREAASLKEFLNAAIEVSKKGLSIQRYKGLGEMNPQQLWETTMNPEKRTLLQVSVEDSVKADEIFTILMGDHVESRKEFITKHALEARNIDI